MKITTKFITILFLTLLSSLAMSSEFTITSDRVVVSDGPAVHSGNVIIIIANATSELVVEAKSITVSGNEKRLSGGVKIKYLNTMIKTKNAFLTTDAEVITITMDSAIVIKNNI